jgi:hypothetical protein
VKLTKNYQDKLQFGENVLAETKVSIASTDEKTYQAYQKALEAARSEKSRKKVGF